MTELTEHGGFWTLAIDLGTSNTVAAVRTGDGLPGILQSVPSTVYLDGGSVYVGEAAVSHAGENPLAFHPAPKRELIEAPERREELVPVLSALYREVYGNAVGHCGPALPGEIVLTHPAALSDTGVDVLRRAAVAAGIPETRIRTVTEPAAAASWYCRFSDNPERLLVIDIGGGTTDVALLRFTSTGLPVTVSRDGDNSLGGRTWDHRVIIDVASRLDDGEPEPGTVSMLGSPTQYPCVRQARERLSSQETVTVPVADEDAGVDGGVDLTREHLDRITAGEREKVLALVERVRRRAPGSVDAVMTGGLALTPGLQRDIGAQMRLHPVDDPFSAVAAGALLVEWPDEREKAASSTGPGIPSVLSHGSGAAAGATVSAVDDRSRRRRGLRTGIAVGLALAVVVAGAIVGINRFGGSDGTGTGASPEQAPGPVFDPSPVTPVVVTGDSVLRESAGAHTLTCGRVADALLSELEGAESLVDVPTVTGMNGNTRCALTTGSSGLKGIALETFTPRRFSVFNNSRNRQSQLEITVPRPDLPDWYRISDIGGLRAKESSFLYVAGAGWLVITVTGQEPIDARIGDHLMGLVDPLIGRAG
ncbi:Hsp70 family protein [uncultured Corynebacterium sp.]|uniref:Hsp70 family protein n=1 Tax=uncultured Corynebacterium sp. TaxID=159447 RepID=UPI0025F8977E|nr:Hsp70 family protein [uncultured Corynebacterium sp.]